MQEFAVFQCLNTLVAGNAFWRPEITFLPDINDIRFPYERPAKGNKVSLTLFDYRLS